MSNFCLDRDILRIEPVTYLGDGFVSVRDLVLGTDGVLAVYSLDGTLLIVEGTYGSVNNHRIVYTDNPITVLVEKSRIVFSAPKATTIHFTSERQVHLVKLNGEKTRNWRRNKDTGVVSVPVQSGYGTITFEE